MKAAVSKIAILVFQDRGFESHPLRHFQKLSTYGYVFIIRVGRIRGVEGSSEKKRDWIPVCTGMTKKRMHLLNR